MRLSLNSAGLAVVFGAFCGACPALALDMRVSGSQILLSGNIVDGDEHRFREIMDSPAGANIRVVRLNSGGGKIEPAGQIGRIIRRRGLATLVEAGSSRCGSACTVIFASGATRHYVGADRIQDGEVGRDAYRGLAYHQGNNPLSRASGRFSGQATGAMISWYYEFGSSGARDLPDKAPPQKFYQISGATALSRGIATSLSRP
jgi:hypothetical protein